MDVIYYFRSILWGTKKLFMFWNTVPRNSDCFEENPQGGKVVMNLEIFWIIRIMEFGFPMIWRIKQISEDASQLGFSPRCKTSSPIFIFLNHRNNLIQILVNTNRLGRWMLGTKIIFWYKNQLGLFSFHTNFNCFISQKPVKILASHSFNLTWYNSWNCSCTLLNLMKN